MMRVVPTSTGRFLAVAAASALLGAGASTLYANPPAVPSPAGSASAGAGPAVREYSLDIAPKDIEMAPGVVWHAWTYNGSVPGPLLIVTAGETLRVRVHNHHTLIHSFHTHLAPYSLENDGSQLNILTGVGKGAMVPPGGDYTYEFHPTTPGIYYYHCHSADGDKMISQHIAQGLYGAIIVKAPDEQPVRDEAVFMAERGFDVTGDGAPYFLMNGKGIPGGEHALEGLFAKQGLPGVVAQFGKTLPLINATAGETVRISVINIGDQVHSFHIHGVNLVSVDMMPGRMWPANVVQLVPGGADRVLVTPTEPGVWLYHCHVVSHADSGMIGVMVVKEASAA